VTAMLSGRRPPRLVVKTLAVTFMTVFVLLAVVFVVVTFSVREQVRQAVTTSLESSHAKGMGNQMRHQALRCQKDMRPWHQHTEKFRSQA